MAVLLQRVDYAYYANTSRSQLMRGLRQDGEDEQKGFWEVLEAKLRDDLDMTKAKFAEEIGISAQGLTSWKNRNQFRRSALVVAAKLLQWPELDEDLATKQYGLNLIENRIVRNAEPEDDFEDQLRLVNKMYRRNEKRFKDYGKLTLSVIDRLGEGGFFGFSACTTSPFEFEKTREGESIALAIAQAISRGVLCLYIRPTEKGAAYYSRKWGYGRVVDHAEAVGEIAAFRSLVKEMLTKFKAVKDKKITSQEAERLVYERLDQCYVDRSPMWMPGVGLSMLGQFRRRTDSTGGDEPAGRQVRRGAHVPTILCPRIPIRAILKEGRTGRLQGD